MSRIGAVAGSSTFGNIVGSLTLVATVVLGVLGLRSDQGPAAASGAAPMGFSPVHFWGFLVFAGVLGIGLSLPSWIALFRTPKGSTAVAPAVAIPPDTVLPKIEEIVNQTFRNQEVPLDNHAYFACTFENCSFVYNFGPTGGFGPGCKFSGSRGIKSSDPRLQHLLHFLESLGLLNPYLKPLYTPKTSTLIAEGSIEDEAQREIHLVLNDRDHPYWDEKKRGHKDSAERMQKLYRIAYPGRQNGADGPIHSETRPELSAPSALSRKEYNPISAEAALEFRNSLASLPAPLRLPIKIICTAKGRAIGELVAKILAGLDFEMAVNKEDASHIFVARPDQPDGILLRGPANLINPMMTALQKGLYGIDLAFKLNNFPADPEYNFIQMEIGDRGEGSQWE